MKLKVIFAVILITLSLFIVFPLLCVALTPHKADFALVLSSRIWHKAMLNTLLECICSTTLSVLVGYLFAYAVIKADIPLKKFFGFVPVLHLMTPPFVGGLSFILLFGRQGFFTKTLLGLDVSLYGFPGLLVAQTLCFFPIAYLICAQTLKGINPSLEQASRAMGASKFRIFRTITLPLSLPGILSAALFIAVSVLSDFGNPMIVAGRFKVLAVEIYTQLTGWVNGGVSSVLGLVLVIPSVALFLLQNHMVKKQNSRLATIGAKGSSLPEKKSSTATRILLTLFCSLISILVFAQFISIIAGAFQKLWGVNTEFTLDHLKSMGRFSLELKNSIIFAFAAAFLGTLIASITTFIVGRTDLPLKKFLDVIVQVPAAIPGSLMGLALSLAASKTRIHASALMVIIAMTTAFLPFSYRILTSVLSQIKTSMDDGGRALGADKLKTFTSILLPLSSGGIFSSFVYDFVRGVGTISSVIFLVSFKTPLSSIKILNLAEQGDWGKAACLALILTALTFGILLVSKIFIKIKLTAGTHLNAQLQEES